MAGEEYPSAQPFLPDTNSHRALARAAAGCRGCPLYKDATHVVFGEGPTDASLMLVGEAPGKSEDQAGEPFVGSAGKALDQALEQVGLRRDQLYISNAVKHIKWAESDGRKKIKTPSVKEIKACRPWLTAEIELVQPKLAVAMGTRAARSMLGEEASISSSRGELHASLWQIEVIVTYHPAAALRHPVSAERERIREALIEDLTRARDHAGMSPA